MNISAIGAPSSPSLWLLLCFKIMREKRRNILTAAARAEPGEREEGTSQRSSGFFFLFVRVCFSARTTTTTINDIFNHSLGALSSPAESQRPSSKRRPRNSGRKRSPRTNFQRGAIRGTGEAHEPELEQQVSPSSTVYPSLTVVKIKNFLKKKFNSAFRFWNSDDAQEITKLVQHKK